MLKKIVVKFFKINLSISLGLYLIYRIFIMEINASGNGFFATILHILNIALNLGFAAVYLLAALIGSATVLLNLNKKIRNNSLTAWLSFSGLSASLALFLIVNIIIDERTHRGNIMTTLLLFALLHVLFTSISFAAFKNNSRRMLQ